MRKFGETLVLILMRLFSIAFGLFIGLLILGYRYTYFPMELSFWEHCMAVLPLLAVFLAGQYVKIIVHELGHVVFGLLSGYRFVSFRAASLVLVRVDGKFGLRRYAFPGTAGQCQMSPPEMADGHIPTFLFSMGGCIANLIAGIICFGAFAAFRHDPFWRRAFLILALDNVYTAISNGVPVRSAAVANDGHNAVSMRRDPEFSRSFWIQMHYSEELVRGTRLKDMPEDWFPVPSDEQMKHRVLSFYGIASCARLFDQRRFAEADELMAHMTAIDSGLGVVQKGALELERVYVELLGENRPEVREKLLTKDAKKARSILSKSPDILCFEYAWALLADKDPAKAEKVRKQFEAKAKNYLYPGEIEASRELMAMARDRAQVQ